MVEIEEKPKEIIIEGPKREPILNAEPYPERIKYEDPIIDKNNICYWSNTYKKLITNPQGKAIAAKALKFVKNNCIEYDKEKKCYLCKPIKGYNSTTYEMRNQYDLPHKFNCTCQFHNKVVIKQKELCCSHVAALRMYLKIVNSEKRQSKIDAEHAGRMVKLAEETLRKIETFK